MKTLLLGAAIGALVLPAAPAFAQHFSDDGHDHACIDEACTVFELFQAPPAPAGGTVQGYQGIATPKYGTWGFDLAGRDTSVNPGDNFFRYANGAALDRLQIPSDRTSYGSFNLLRELSDNRVKVMIDGLAARTDLTAGSDEQKIADAYRSYMDEARIEALDAQPLAPYLAAIRTADTHDKAAVYMGSTQGRVGGSIFGTGITTDQKAPTRYVVSTGQSGIGLPNRDYYLAERWADKKVLYQAYVARMLEMIGWENPVENAAAIVAFETRIAEAHWTPEQNRNRDETYNEYTIAKLAEEAPGFPWQDYYNAVGVGEVPRLIVRQDTALPAIAAIYAETPIETIQAWQAFHTTDDAAGRLSKRFADAQWEFRSRDLQEAMQHQAEFVLARRLRDQRERRAVERSLVERPVVCGIPYQRAVVDDQRQRNAQLLDHWASRAETPPGGERHLDPERSGLADRIADNWRHDIRRVEESSVDIEDDEPEHRVEYLSALERAPSSLTVRGVAVRTIPPGSGSPGRRSLVYHTACACPGTSSGRGPGRLP